MFLYLFVLSLLYCSITGLTQLRTPYNSDSDDIEVQERILPGGPPLAQGGVNHLPNPCRRSYDPSPDKPQIERSALLLNDENDDVKADSAELSTLIQEVTKNRHPLNEYSNILVESEAVDQDMFRRSNNGVSQIPNQPDNALEKLDRSLNGKALRGSDEADHDESKKEGAKILINNNKAVDSRSGSKNEQTKKPLCEDPKNQETAHSGRRRLSNSEVLTDKEESPEESGRRKLAISKNADPESLTIARAADPDIKSRNLELDELEQHLLEPTQGRAINEVELQSRKALLLQSTRVCYACSTLNNPRCLVPDRDTTIKYCRRGHDACVKRTFDTRNGTVIVRDCGSACREVKFAMLEPKYKDCSLCSSDLCNSAYLSQCSNTLYIASIFFITIALKNF